MAAMRAAIAERAFGPFRARFYERYAVSAQAEDARTESLP